jgi:hypothetical protein
MAPDSCDSLGQKHHGWGIIRIERKEPPMTLRSCRGCGREVDTTAKRCPNYGRRHPASSGWGIGKISVGVVIVLFMTYTFGACIDAREKPTRNSSPPPRSRDVIATEATDQFSAIADLLPDEAGDLVLLGASVEGSGQGRRATLPNPSDWSAEGQFAWRNGANGDDLRLSAARLRCFAKTPDSGDKPLCGPGSQKRKLQVGIEACLLPRPGWLRANQLASTWAKVAAKYASDT